MEITSDLALRPLDNKIEAKVRLSFCAVQSTPSVIVLMSNIMIMTNQSRYTCEHITKNVTILSPQNLLIET